MLVYRAAISLALVIVGAIVLVRMFHLGFGLPELPGLVLGAAVIALGVYRLRQILRVWAKHP
ncbi:MAG: hypothetical protein HKL92_08455 [Candidatus Eremiobacteraeota bacterium]|nr:hypothetical protein [Candidatus Eremiobacteraeota bacterium]